MQNASARALVRQFPCWVLTIAGFLASNYHGMLPGGYHDSRAPVTETSTLTSHRGKYTAWAGRIAWSESSGSPKYEQEVHVTK